MNKEIKKELTMPSKPTETRPPKHEHPEACPVCDSPYCEHDEAEQNLIKKAWEAGRAAAPVEPPKYSQASEMDADEWDAEFRECPNCLGEKGFWVDRKDPRNSTYMQDNDADEFQECGECKGTGRRK